MGEEQSVQGCGKMLWLQGMSTVTVSSCDRMSATCFCGICGCAC